MLSVRRPVFVALWFVVLTAGVFVSAQDPGVRQRPAPGQGPTVSEDVRDRVARDGRARVLVQLRLAGGQTAAAEGGLMRSGGAGAVLAQRQAIASARAAVLSRVGSAARERRRFETTPYVALEISASDLAVLEASPDVERIRPDGVLRFALEASAPKIEADQVWQAGYDGTGTMVAVIDSGVDASHPFFGGRVVEEACFSSTSTGLSQSLCPDGGNQQLGAGAGGPCAMDDCFHGTHVAGIVAGRGSDAGVPFSGVAPGATLAAVQVFSQIVDDGICGGMAPCLGAFESDIIAGLEHAYSLKAAGRNLVAVNMSLGGGSFDAPCDDEPFKPIIDNLRAVGVATVVASGNISQPAQLASPACISSAISVGATSPPDQVAWFSNVAPFLSLLAPGDGILSALPDGDYEFLSGTSMAAPHVAGGWALMRQAVPGISVDAALSALQTTGVPVTDTREWAPGTTTTPRVRLLRALSTLVPIANPFPVLTSVTPLTAREGVSVTLTVTGSGFNAQSIVRWNGVSLPTIADSITRLTAEVPAELMTLGTAQVSVFNPAPGGGTSAALGVPVLPPPSLTINKTVVGPSAPITVTLQNGFGGQFDWIGLAATSAPNASYLGSTFVGAGVLDTTWTITAPPTPGTYEFRLFLNNGFQRLATSPSFTVDAAVSPAPVVSSMSPTSAVAGSAPITLMVLGSHFVSSSVIAWNGSPRPTTYVNTTQLKATISAADLASAGAFPVTVVTPSPGGGSAPLTFNVSPAPVLTVNSTTVTGGSNVTVTLANGLGGQFDWLAWAQVGAPDNHYLLFTYVGAGVTSRTWTIATPTTPGTYEFRLYRNGSFLRAATSPTVTVQGSVPTPALTISSATVTAGQSVTVTLTNGQGGTQDWLAFAPVGAAANSYVQFTYVGAGVTTRTWTITAPSTPGNYEFRLFRQGTFSLLAKSPVVAVQAAAPAMLTVSTTSAAPGQSVTVTMSNGPGGQTDWLALAAVGSPDNVYVTWTYVGSGVTSRTWTVTMPSTPGQYEFRLYRQASFVRAATSPPVQVQPAPDDQR